VNPTAVPGIKIILTKAQEHIGYSEENIKNNSFFLEFRFKNFKNKCEDLNMFKKYLFLGGIHN